MHFRYIGLAALQSHAMLAVKEAVDETARELEHDVKRSMPHLTDEMEHSTNLHPTIVVGHTVRRKLSVDAEYSVFEHEKLWYHHDDGRAKFVKFPLVRALPRLRRRLRAASSRRF